MISIDSLLYKIDQRLNKLSTNAHQQIQLEDKILALNEAQIKLIKQKVDGFSAPSGLGMDSFKKRYQDLENLIIKYDNTPLELKESNKTLNEWEADLSKLNPSYLFYIDSYIIANKENCKNRIIWINRDLATHSDLQFILNNNHYKPSFEYQETFNVITGNKILVYTDGTFIPNKIYISYLKYPSYIDKSGYEDFQGKLSEDKDCELQSHLEDELLDLTVQNLAMYTENASAVQSSQFRIQTNE